MDCNIEGYIIECSILSIIAALYSVRPYTKIVNIFRVITSYFI